MVRIQRIPTSEAYGPMSGSRGSSPFLQNKVVDVDNLKVKLQVRTPVRCTIL